MGFRGRGGFIYTPPANWAGDDGFTYQIANSLGSSEGTVTIGIYNSPPYPADDWYYMTHDTTLEITSAASGIKANDYDSDHDMEDVTLTVETMPSHADSFTWANDGTFTYEPTAGWAGTDTFTYTLDDGIDESYAATVTIGVMNHDPVATTISDVWHWAQDETNQQINLWNVFDDSDDTDQQLTYSIVGTPDAGVVSASIDQGTGVLTLDFGATPGTTEVTVRATDRCGEEVDTAFDVWVVEVTGCTAERQLDDGSWVSVPHSEVSWSHDTMRWTAQVAPEGVTVYSVDWQTTAWEDRENPFATWTSFAASSGLEAAEGTPPVGELAVAPYVSFPGVSVRMDPAVRKIVAEIVGIQWMTHSDANSAAELYDPGYDDIRAHPDATTPGGSLRSYADVRIQVMPQIAGISIVLKSVDVDDPSDDDGPIDADPAPIDSNYMHMRPENGIDNLGGVGAGTLDSALRETDANGQVRVTFDMGAQPGNNFRVVAGGRQEDLDCVLARSADANSEVFYDNDDNGIYNPEAYGGYEGGDQTLSETMSVRNLVATRRLTVWRYLHVEVDSMGEVWNPVFLTSFNVLYDNGSTFSLGLNDSVSEGAQDQLQGGTLVDSNGTVFDIVGFESSTKVTIQKINASDPDPRSGTVRMLDDDLLQTGDDVPMPDTSTLAAAMAEAYVEVLFDVGDSNDDVPFVLNVTYRNEPAAYDWDSVADNSASYWVTYILGAFQGDVFRDNDPNNEDPADLGITTSPPGGSIIYLETIRDVSVNNYDCDPAEKERDTVVHEVGHAVASKPDHPVTRWADGVPSRYAEDYLKAIREAESPW